MRSPNVLRRAVWVLAASATVLFGASAHAQLNSESLNPNPMLPAGPGSAGELEEFHHGSSGGTRMGRGIGGRVDGADQNPADIMLRDIGGSNRGRRTGRAAIRGAPVRAALRVEGPGQTARRADEGAVYFARRGEYENVIYAPYRGSYRQAAPARRPATRNTSQQ